MAISSQKFRIPDRLGEELWSVPRDLQLHPRSLTTRPTPLSSVIFSSSGFLLRSPLMIVSIQQENLIR